MARAQASDFLHNFRFQVTDAQNLFLDPQAGFTSVTPPETTLEVAEYREGGFTYTRKYPGIPTQNDITMSRGVAKNDSKFFEWITAALDGSEYRTDLVLRHFHRDSRTNPARVMLLHEAWPMRVKLTGDLDSTSSDVSIHEVEVSCEFYELNVPAVALPSI